MATAVEPPDQVTIRRVVEKDPARLGGEPVFRGTRVPVKSLFDHLKAGDSIEVFLDDFPGVTPEQVRTVLDLAGTHLLEDDLNVQLPGASKGKVASYWLAPYVRVSTENIGKRNVTTVTWYAENGEVKRTTEVQSVQPGFVTRISRQIPAFLAENRWTGSYLGAHEFRTIMQGVNEDWRLTLPRKPGLSEYVTANPDSRVLLYQYTQPTNGTTDLSVYVEGNLATNIGPYAQYRGESVSLGDDGSAALLIWKDGSQSNAEVVVLGADGQVRFQVGCDREVGEAVPGLEGSGVLLRSDRKADPNTYVWYTKDGKARSLDCGTNANFAGWIPGSHKCVFDTSIGYDHRYRFIDWDTTNILWEVYCPSNGRVLAIGCSTNFVLLAVAEPYKKRPYTAMSDTTYSDPSSARCFYAVNISDGKIVAKWSATFPRQIPLNQNQSFVRVRGKLYYLTPDEFAEIREDEIAAKTNHWYAMPP